MLEADLNKERIFQKVFQELYKDVFLYVFVFFTCIITFFIYLYYKEITLYDYQFLGYFSGLVNVIVALFFSWSIYFYFRMLLKKQNELFKAYFTTLLKMMSKPEKVVVFIFRLILINVFISNYTYLKQIIPDINLFYYDEIFFELDKFLHSGVSPWELSHSFFIAPIGLCYLIFLITCGLFLFGGLFYTLCGIAKINL